MSTPRRRLMRPTPASDAVTQQRQRRVETLRQRLAGEQAALKRWTSRLRRAFTTTDKLQQRIERITKQLTTLEGR
ncbi:MAG: hypothetical protein ACJ8C4_09755 [Gemmataceae bacterium]